MYVIVHHQLTDPPTVFERGNRLVAGEGAPASVRVLQFLPGPRRRRRDMRLAGRGRSRRCRPTWTTRSATPASTVATRSTRSTPSPTTFASCNAHRRPLCKFDLARSQNHDTTALRAFAAAEPTA